MSDETRQQMVDLHYEWLNSDNEHQQALGDKWYPYYQALQEAFDTGRPLRVVVVLDVAIIDEDWDATTIIQNIPTYVQSALSDAELEEFTHCSDQQAYFVDADDLTVYLPTPEILELLEKIE